MQSLLLITIFLMTTVSFSSTQQNAGSTEYMTNKFLTKYAYNNNTKEMEDAWILYKIFINVPFDTCEDILEDPIFSKRRSGASPDIPFSSCSLKRKLLHTLL